MMKPLSEVTGAGWKCQHDYFSYQALVLALTEFAVPKVSAAGMAGTRFLLLGKVATKLAAKEGFIGKVFKKIKPKAGWREEFKLEKNIIHVIYFQARPHALLPPTFHHPHVVISHASAPRPAIHFQALLWFMQPFFPFGAVLGPILLFLDYKWEVLELVRFSRKSNKPFNAGASTLYFLYCYIFTGMLFCVFWGEDPALLSHGALVSVVASPHAPPRHPIRRLLPLRRRADDGRQRVRPVQERGGGGVRHAQDRGVGRRRRLQGPLRLLPRAAVPVGGAPRRLPPRRRARLARRRARRVRRGAAGSVAQLSLSLPRLTTPLLSPLQVQTQANLSTTALLQQRLRKVEKERDVARKIEGRIRQEIRRRETQESVADDGWKSGGEG